MSRIFSVPKWGKEIYKWLNSDGIRSLSKRPLRTTMLENVALSLIKLQKLPSIDDRGQTDRVTTPTRVGDSAVAAGPGRITAHAFPR